MSRLIEDDVKLRNQITQRFINLRESTGLTQSEFAKQHEIDRQQINRWESNQVERGVTIYTINKFCRFFKMTLKEFFDSPIFEDESKC